MSLPADPVKWATKAFDDGRNEVIDTYADYLDGKHPIAYATESFRKTFGRIFDSFAYNRLASVVEAHNDRLQVTGLAADDTTLAQAAQDQWDANRMDVREGEATGDALAYGDGFVIVEKDARSGDVHYWINDPRIVRVHYDTDRPGHLDLAAKRWIDEDQYGRLTLYFAGHVERYVSRNKMQGGFLTADPTGWERRERSDAPAEYALDVKDTVPVFHLANAARTGQYGVSEIKLLIPLQDAINYVLMSSMVATEFSAFSQKVLMGVQPESDEERQAFEDFRVGVNRILTLFDENAKIGEFSATNLSAYIELAEFWDTTVARVSRVPAHYLKMTETAESGEAKRMNEAPFTAKLTDRQRRFGYTYSEAVTYGLRAAGMNVPPGAVRVNWQTAAPHSDRDMWDLIALMQTAGVPFPTALRIGGGFEPDQIEKIVQERETERLAVQRFLDAGGLDPMPGGE